MLESYINYKLAYTRIDGLIKPLDTNEESSSKIIWHPTASAFAAATNTRDLQVMSRDDWSPQKSFQDGHGSDITAAAWSPNGALLVTADKNRKLNLWEAKSQSILRKYDDASSTKDHQSVGQYGGIEFNSHCRHYGRMGRFVTEAAWWTRT